MKTGITINELITEVQRQSKAKSICSPIPVSSFGWCRCRGTRTTWRW